MTLTIHVSCYNTPEGLALFAYLFTKGYGFTSDCGLNAACFVIPGIIDADAFKRECMAHAPNASYDIFRG